MAGEDMGAIGQQQEGVLLPYSCGTKLQTIVPEIEHGVPSCVSRPFSGLVICVTGLSKEARKQVMEATDRLGGRYSSTLHPECTHLVVQSFGGSKLLHILKHGCKNRLFVVTLGWFVDSVRKNVRLCESPYTVHSVAKVDTGKEDSPVDLRGTHNSCVPLSLDQTLESFEEKEGQKIWYSEEKFEGNKHCHLLGHSIYIDPDVSANLRSKVADAIIQEGAVLVDHWFIGCGVSYVVCEGSSIQSYLGHTDNIVSPVWVLKTSEERSMRRCVRLSPDLARQVGSMFEDVKHVTAGQDTFKEKFHEKSLICERNRVSQAERLQTVNLAKCGIRNRRARRLQSSDVLLRPLNPSTLLDSICWSVSEPPSTAAVYADSLLSKDHSGVGQLSEGVEGLDLKVSFSTFLQPLTESEKSKLIFKNNFLTILFPLDRFAEMGPSSRTYFSETGFKCLQLLDFIYDFYQENMSDHEIEAAIHTDSRYSEQLRSVYRGDGREEFGYVTYKRIQLLGSRISLEMLKRINSDNNSNVYELLIRA